MGVNKHEPGVVNMLHRSFSPPYLPWETKIGLFIFINIMAVHGNIGLWCLNVYWNLT